MCSQLVDEEKGEAGIVIADEHGDVTQGVPKEKCFATNDQASPTPPDSPTSTAASGSSTTLFESQARDLRRFLASLRRHVLPGSDRRSSVAQEYKPKYIVQQLHTTPNGYPRLAAFLDSDENFMLYRRFGYLQSRLLLDKQDDLRLLENQLEQMDAADDRDDPDVLRSREDHGDDDLKPRADLMQSIEKKWLEYSNLLVAAKQVTGLGKPTSSEYHSVHYWIKREDPLSSQDSQFVRHREDLITLRPGREHAWLDAAVEKLLRSMRLPWLGNFFRSEETRHKMQGSLGITYYTRQRISYLVNTIMILMILVLLIVPVYILFHVTDNETDSPGTEGICIGVLLVSTLAFSAGVSLFSRARRHEVLAASAAYCAVLVVFIGNIGGRGLSYKGPR